MRFAKNSSPDAPSGCPHPLLQYIVDSGWHTIECVRCRDRWTLMGARTKPKYSDDALTNHAGRDPSFNEDACVGAPNPLGLRR